ncbi:hypothetical protein BOTBODRAFT_174861 [Botryobasidium botryosum FD-172 SS1]|uniref:MYND-type domain-containing protein n=1 Tax=Botryobasidium botryosum (strain FD-172 SS1) TaxID=930990 RepID=A0A067MS52_BOTB1|nr:hypothetical protein BOTBODRAFT_174861 [Botryobasidium botryosum FD-172 SS1]
MSMQDLTEAQHALLLAASLRGDFGGRKAERKQVKVRCSFCDKESETGKLAACARCRSVRYCDANCQVAHFRASHKADCENFKDPPSTDLFNTRNRPGTNYAINPIFARGSSDGVGCWVSVDSKIDLRLDTILSSTTAFPLRQELIADPKTAGILAKQKGEMKNILTLRVLVQNRRKDRAAATIFSFTSGIMAKEDSHIGKALKKWKALGGGGLIVDFDEPATGLPKIMCAHPFVDPWGVFRCSVLSVNGVQYPDNTKFPRTSTPPSTAPLNKIRDPAKAVVTLGYGDYAVLEMQFRCVDIPEPFVGDLPIFDALLDIIELTIGWSKQDDYNTKMPNKESQALFARFDYEAINAYYADFMEGGPAAHIASHFIDSSIDPKGIPREKLERASSIMSAFKGVKFPLGLNDEVNKISSGGGIWSSLTDLRPSHTGASPSGK